MQHVTWHEIINSSSTVHQKHIEHTSQVQCHQNNPFHWHATLNWNTHLTRWVYSLLSSGWLSSAPTLPSNVESVFRETGTNREVSGGLGVELLDETFLMQVTEAACCFLCPDTTPGDTWLLPAQVQAARELMWRWSRESNNEQRVADMTASPLPRGGRFFSGRRTGLSRL